MSQQHTFENEFQSFGQLPNYCSFCGSKFLINDTHCQKCNRMRIQKRISKQQPQVRWKKVLYEKQPYEDNYLDETFLSSLISQDSPARLTYPEVVLKAMEVSLATTFVALYLMIYRSMLEEWIDSKIIVAVHLIAVFPLLMLSMFLSPKITKVKKIFLALKEGGVGIIFLFILSPLLETLFKNYASNTTYAISCGLILLHLFFRDYSYVYSTEDNKLNIDWSTLAVMFLTVILGSRLQGVIQVFTLWIASLTLFVFSRMLQKSLRAYSPKFYNYLSLALIIGMGIFLYQVSKIVIIAYLLVNFIIFFVGPLALVWFYQYKNVIHGPWDIPDVAQLDE